MLELFPYEKVRKIQDELIKTINEVVTNQKNAVIHAPTGLGKTVASLAPTIKYAKANGKKVFFLTSRHSQHKIAIDTVQEMNKKAKIKVSNIIGKKFMCLQNNVTMLHAGEFSEFCRKLKEDDSCDYYKNTYVNDGTSHRSKEAIKLINIGSSEEIFLRAKDYDVCPYEIAIQNCKDSDVIIADYYYIFNQRIRDRLLARINIELEDCIIIVDEAHNLPERIKGLMSDSLSKVAIERAIAEAKKFELSESIELLEVIQNTIAGMASEGEHLVNKQGLCAALDKMFGYDIVIETLESGAEIIREKQNRSYIGGVVKFLESWKGQEEGFTRILESKEGDFYLKYLCMDPGVVNTEIVDRSSSLILMSGTLTPVSMYAELLGINNIILKEFGSPFPEANKLSLIIPKTSTKYEKRTNEMYKQIAEVISDSVNKIPGNVAVFFPSYFVKDQIKNKVVNAKAVFDEVSGFTPNDKQEFLNNFKGYAHKGEGAILFGVMGGSFSEGIDLPGAELHGVIIVGLPLTKPDLETEELIKYYDKKFGKGRDYGYVFPAFNKTLQSAGRCIRSETDRGVVIFLDERYLWSNYYKCFPAGNKPRVSFNYAEAIKNFFGK